MAGEPLPDIEAPELDPSHLQQLMDMGFSDALSRKALILNRSR